jgi:hypothetical protein
MSGASLTLGDLQQQADGSVVRLPIDRLRKSTMTMSGDDSEIRLRGRRSERAALDGVLDTALAGSSAVLVLCGEPGIGKTALLRYAAGRASGFRVLRASGFESEMELPFAGLHQLCGPLLGQLEQLPGPQRDALRVAFGLREGNAPDRLLVGLAVLSLLARAADDQPLACLVDDAQWLDRSSLQSLAFVARRLLAEPVAVLFAVRGVGDEHELAGLPQLTVRGLGERDARALLASVVHGPLDPPVRDRIVAEAGGNPLALLQLPRGLGPADLAGGFFWLADARPVSSRIEHSFAQRFLSLPPESRRLLLIAAAERSGDVALLRRAARRQGIPVDAAAPAEAAGLVELGPQMPFRHPLARSAVYRMAAREDRRAAHRALAEALDPEVDPDRRAWHRAHAAVGPDESVARELQSSAGRAQARGGLAAAAAFFEHAAVLTPDPAQRSERALAAAAAKVQAGAFEAALTLLAMAEAAPLDEMQRARVDLLRARLAFAANRGSDAPPLLLRAAKRLEPIDAGLARETYLDAVNAALFAGRLASPGGTPQEVAAAARAAPRPSHPPRAPDLLLDGLAANWSEGYAAGSPLLRRALCAFDRETSAEEDLRWLWLACAAAISLWDDARWDTLSDRYVHLTREAGALSELPLALNQRAGALLFAGELAAAASFVEEVQVVQEATGSRLAPYGSLALAALRGREAEMSILATTRDEIVQRGEGIGIGLSDWATAVLHNGLGHYQNAMAAAETASAYLPNVSPSVNWGLVELVEAAARCGSLERAADAMRRLSESTSASGSDWALGVEARSRALLSEAEAADRLYREAIERLGPTRMRVDLARAHLLYGEWLRRENHRVAARGQLRAAHQMLTAMGVVGFAERARQELMATGETVRKRTVDTFAELTAQEAQIARLARDGRTNQEISGQLFISPRTVEWHLRNVFGKLGITSRKELH